MTFGVVGAYLYTLMKAILYENTSYFSRIALEENPFLTRSSHNIILIIFKLCNLIVQTNIYSNKVFIFLVILYL
jgi:uncharacterized membrane protein